MTNFEIIETAKEQLYKEGKLKLTDRYLKMLIYNPDTQQEEWKTLPQIEDIHTFVHWKSLGYQVKRGEKAVAKFSIWKPGKSKKVEKGIDKDTGEEVEQEVQFNKMFMIVAAFFSESQVEPITEEAV